jgi:hypothetical protein
MRFHKRPFKENIHLLWQSSIVFILMTLFLLAMHHLAHADTTLGAIGASSLGSSAFLAFVAHDTVMARAPRMIWGYVLGIIVGVLVSIAVHYVDGCHAEICTLTSTYAVGAGVAALLLMLLMNMFDCQHPPAIGIAIGVILRGWTWYGLLIVMVFVLWIALLRKVLRPYLINLL